MILSYKLPCDILLITLPWYKCYLTSPVPPKKQRSWAEVAAGASHRPQTKKRRAPREATNQHLAPGLLLMLEQSVSITLEPWNLREGYSEVLVDKVPVCSRGFTASSPSQMS